MRRLALLALVLVLQMASAAADSFIVLCYHEVRDDVRDYPDPYAVDADALVRQFAWLKGNGYQPVSLDEILAARRGGKPLPAKAVLLSFDDAYLSFYTRVYPLLREYRFPAVLGVVGSWIDNPRSTTAVYGEKSTVPDAEFPSWGQIREMQASGLVEVASHSYDLHRGVPANPQGNLQPAATARVYDGAAGRYEDDASWRARVRADLARNSEVIARETGRRPRAIVWPYGSYNGELVRMAAELGMPIALTLEEGANGPEVPLAAMRRVLIAHNPALAEFAIEVRGALRPEPVRVVQLNLDAIHHADPVQQERNLSLLLDRMQALKPSHVILKATADPNSDGIADSAYFPARHLALRADLFNRVAWQLASRTDVKVYAFLPDIFRLTQNQITDTYEDLARHAPIDGLLFVQGTMEFTQRIVETTRQWRALKIARQYADDAQAALDTRSDQVVLTGTPVRSSSLNPARVVYLLGDGDIARQMRTLQLGGALNFGYRGDDVLRDQPPFTQVAPMMSLRVHPTPESRQKK